MSGVLALVAEPFALGFMRRALAGCLALSVAGPPLGVFLVLRRMSLMTDVLQHGITPGLAVGAAVAGLSVPAMGLGGFLAGLAVALLAGVLTRATGGREDSQLAATYLVALALGVAIVSRTRSIDLTHLLFGSVLAVDDPALALMASAATVALFGLAVIWRPLILESFDAEALRVAGGQGAVWHLAFLALVVLCVVAGFTALGTLMAVGLIVLPAVAARHWAMLLAGQVRVSVVLAAVASVVGLMLSFDWDVPTGPAIVLTAGLVWVASFVAGPRESLLVRALRRPHLAE